MSKRKKRYKLKVVLSRQDDLFSDAYKYTIRDNYIKSQNPSHRITKGEIQKLSKLINEKLEKAKLSNDDTFDISK